MPRPNNVFKLAANNLLAWIAAQDVGEPLPSESRLAALCDVSRTTIRAALDYAIRRGIVVSRGSSRQVARRPVPDDYFDLAQVRSRSEQIERRFMERVLLRDLRPGQQFSEVQLARDVGASTTTVREFLIRFSRYGLIEKRPRGGWRLCAFDLAFANELADMRLLIEIAALDRLALLSPDAPAWRPVAELLARHRALQAEIEERYLAFSNLDRDFHRFIIDQLDNRFAHGFYDLISFIFHYHYQWDKSDEKERNAVAIGEHLAVLEALQTRDIARAKRELDRHLATSRRTLTRSIVTGTG